MLIQLQKCSYHKCPGCVARNRRAYCLYNKWHWNYSTSSILLYSNIDSHLVMFLFSIPDFGKTTTISLMHGILHSIFTGWKLIIFTALHIFQHEFAQENESFKGSQTNNKLKFVTIRKRHATRNPSIGKRGSVHML